MAVLGTPSASLSYEAKDVRTTDWRKQVTHVSKRIFFSATISLVTLHRALYTTPYEPSPIFSIFVKVSSIEPEARNQCLMIRSDLKGRTVHAASAEAGRERRFPLTSPRLQLPLSNNRTLRTPQTLSHSCLTQATFSPLLVVSIVVIILL